MLTLVVSPSSLPLEASMTLLPKDAIYGDADWNDSTLASGKSLKLFVDGL